MLLTQHECNQLHLHLLRIDEGYDLRRDTNLPVHEYRMYRSTYAVRPIYANRTLLSHVGG